MNPITLDTRNAFYMKTVKAAVFPLKVSERFGEISLAGTHDLVFTGEQNEEGFQQCA